MENSYSSLDTLGILETRVVGVETLPDPPFSLILQCLSRKDVLSLSLVSRSVREKIQRNSNILYTYKFKVMDDIQFTQLANTERKIKGLHVCIFKLPAVSHRLREEQVKNADKSIKVLLEKHPELESFTVRLGTYSFTKEIIHSLLSHERIKVVNLNGFTSEGAIFKKESNYSKILHTLNLLDTSLTAEEIIFILSTVGKSLCDLSLESWNSSGEELATFTGSLPRLTKLKLSGWGNLTDKGLEEWMRICAGTLQCIDIPSGNMTEQGYCSLFRVIPNLKSLRLGCTSIIGDILCGLQPCLKLEILNLSSCRNLTDKGILNIAKLAPNLVKLGLERTDITGELFDNIPVFHRLDFLNLGSSELLTDLGILKIVNLAPNLTFLCLRGTLITGEGLMMANQKLVNLKYLNLSCCRLTEQGLSAILRLTPNIQNLDLNNTVEISGERFEVNQKFYHLVKLDLSSGYSLTDLGLGTILKCTPNLKHLKIFNTEINGECFSENLHLVKLEFLDLWKENGCINFKEEAIASVHAVAPNLKVLFLPKHLKKHVSNHKCSRQCFCTPYKMFLEHFYAGDKLIFLSLLNRVQH